MLQESQLRETEREKQLKTLEKEKLKEKGEEEDQVLEGSIKQEGQCLRLEILCK